MTDPRCNTCGYAVWDYEEYSGGAKRWFFDHCQWELEPDDECDKYEEWRGEDEW